MAWTRWGFAPTLYACLDSIVFADDAPEIRRLIGECPGTRFFLPAGAQSAGIRSSSRVAHFNVRPGCTFSGNLLELTDFGNVGATSLQVLALLGHRRIAMVGVDARYRALAGAPDVADENGLVVVDDDPNLFCPEYVHGERLRARPDLAHILGHWTQVAAECANRAMDVRNASIGSALECFPTIDFAGALDWVLGAGRLSARADS